MIVTDLTAEPIVIVRFQKSSRVAMRMCSGPKVIQSYCFQFLINKHLIHEPGLTCHFVRHYNQVVLFGDLANRTELFLVKYFPDAVNNMSETRSKSMDHSRIVWGVQEAGKMSVDY